MQNDRSEHLELSDVRIEDIRIDSDSRDAIPILLRGLQHLYADEALRGRLFALLNDHIPPVFYDRAGQPQMEMWKILVMGVLKRGLGCNVHNLRDLLNNHRVIRLLLGHVLWDESRYELEEILDNLTFVSPELLAEVNQLLVESGASVARKKAWRALRRNRRI